MKTLISVAIFWYFSLIANSQTTNLSFPKDHSFHPDYNLEWCYFVGNLQTTLGELGYELSFFRARLNESIEVFPVHFAISEISKKKHYTAQGIERKYGGLAGYSSQKIWSGDYSLEILSSKEFHIQAKPRKQQIALNLYLSISSEKKILLQGKDGFSPKSYRYPEYYSFYYSIPRMQTKGFFVIEGKKIEVLDGTSWMDHEWSEKGNQKSRLSSSENAWDWVCLNLNDGSEIMAFNFRKSKKDSSESFATWRKPNGEILYFREPSLVSFVPKTKLWKSPNTSISYPLEWNLRIQEISIEISPKIENQEFIALETTGNIYWEGAVSARGKIFNQEIIGNGYLELKGYENQSKILKK